MKKHHIKIVNKGEIPINSFVLMGATTKRDDSTKIGHFGSGLKYAIAVLMREKIPFRVFSGEKEVKFTTRPDVLASTFLEEMIHIKTGFRDCERPMQTYLFEELMHYMKESRENQIKNQIKEPS